MKSANLSGAPGRKIAQKRSQKTYDALITTTFKLLEKREFDDISIAELALQAGYSVGAFYARFRSKDELFDALVVRHLADRTKARDQLFSTLPDAELIEGLIEETVRYYWSRRRFWRAAMVRSMRDPSFWEPIRKQGIRFSELLLARIVTRARRPLTETDEINVRFAVQLALGTINNAIINRPGPIFMEEAWFVENLSRAVRLVSGYDDLVAPGGVPAKRAKSTKAAKHRRGHGSRRR